MWFSFRQILFCVQMVHSYKILINYCDLYLNIHNFFFTINNIIFKITVTLCFTTAWACFVIEEGIQISTQDSSYQSNWTLLLHYVTGFTSDLSGVYAVVELWKSKDISFLVCACVGGDWGNLRRNKETKKTWLLAASNQ